MSDLAERTAKLKAELPSETALCALFIREFNQQPGWTCYPETSGFDIVAAHESGRQIGVEAKLQLNGKVAEQIVPADHWHRYGGPGPDHRLVIVRSVTDANAGIARMLHQLGIEVWEPRFHCRGVNGWCDLQFGIRDRLWKDAEVATPPDWGRPYTGMFDWNPPERLCLPEIPPDVPAGVPAPVQLTPWKQAALRVLARLRVQGSITAKEIASEGCSPSMWTQRWLDRGPVRGQWIESSRLPKFDEQHPEIYAVALERAREAAMRRAA